MQRPNRSKPNKPNASRKTSRTNTFRSIRRHRYILDTLSGNVIFVTDAAASTEKDFLRVPFDLGSLRVRHVWGRNRRKCFHRANPRRTFPSPSSVVAAGWAKSAVPDEAIGATDYRHGNSLSARAGVVASERATCVDERNWLDEVP